MVLPAVLRHPARDPEHARRRDRARGLDPDPRLPAMARYVEGALGALSSALPAVLLGVRGGLRAARLARLESCGMRLWHRRANLYRLLFHLLPDHSPQPRLCGNDQAA